MFVHRVQLAQKSGSPHLDFQVTKVRAQHLWDTLTRQLKQRNSVVLSFMSGRHTGQQIAVQVMKTQHNGSKLIVDLRSHQAHQAGHRQYRRFNYRHQALLNAPLMQKMSRLSNSGTVMPIFRRLPALCVDQRKKLRKAMLGRLEMCGKFESPLESIFALLQKPLLGPFFSVVDTSTDQNSD